MHSPCGDDRTPPQGEAEKRKIQSRTASSHKALKHARGVLLAYELIRSPNGRLTRTIHYSVSQFE